MNEACRALLGAQTEAFGDAVAQHDSELAIWLRDRAGQANDLVLSMDGLRIKIKGCVNEATSPLVLQLERLDASNSGRSSGSYEQLRDLIDNSTALMYIKDTQGRFLVVNDYFSKWFGVPVDDIIGRTNWELFPQSVADEYANNDSAILSSREAIEIEEPETTALFDKRETTDPLRRWLSIKFPLLDAHGVPYAVGGISTDITDRKRAEAAARAARLEAERANRSKDEFLSRMSHELRTPLNAILGFAQLLTTHGLPPSSQEHVEHILSAGQHLLTLVNDALDLSWIDAGSPGMRVDEISAIEPLHRALEIIRPLAVANDVEIASDLHGALHRRVLGDSNRLCQVLLNILGNAVKFNQRGGLVRVSCRADDVMLRYRITDTGRGVSEAERDLLFRPFSRLPGSSDVEGSGLGLILSRRLMTRMQGEVGLEHSGPGEGSTFFVEIPLTGGEDDDAVASSTFAADMALPSLSATLLQIEDSSANRRLIQALVDAMGEVRLYSAETGEAGLRLIEQVQPDLVLLDLNLPGLSGIEVLRALRADTRRHHRVIVLSADSTPTRIEELRAEGADDYVTKPIDIYHLARVIGEVLAS